MTIGILSVLQLNMISILLFSTGYTTLLFALSVATSLVITNITCKFTDN